ncbi:receptor expression enhancing protein [Trichuris trichiura]|uniref:Receptor expression-enhancing protein n=1 Tax=Trichuris trichiura TaxID=36087 RepID=A0A077YZ42_TRITR|nr:receptor expression enhancing protein [Trichuris trichiura]
MAEQFEQIKNDLKPLLYDDASLLGKCFKKLEQSTGKTREECAMVLSSILAIYLVIGFAAELLCNSICFAYPAYMSIIAIESKEKTDDTQWLTYWTVFALFSLIDFFSEKIVGVFPIYWLIKCIFFLWLYLPVYKGAEKLYANWVRPMANKYIFKTEGGDGGAAPVPDAPPPPPPAEGGDAGPPPA